MANETFIPRLSVIAGKIEAVTGVEETLADDDTNMVISDPVVDDNVDLLERNFLTASLSEFAPLLGAKDRRIRFGTELKGSGTPGTAPPMDQYLRACGMLQTETAGVANAYTPVGATETMTIHRYLRDGGSASVKKAIKGAMGAWSLSGNIGNAMRIAFDFLGQYVPVSDSASPSPSDLKLHKPPQLLGVTFTIDGYSPSISTVSVNGGQVVTLPGNMQDLSGRDTAIITKRSVEWNFDAKMSTVNEHDWYGKLASGAEGVLSLRVGSVPGNRFIINSPKLQYTALPEGERDNAAILNVTAKANRDSNAGDDEITIIFD